jgi:hypothetical protein
MSNTPNNILPNDNDATKINLLQALDDELLEPHQIQEHTFETDAAIGLSNISSEKANEIIHSLNKDLNKKLKQKNKRYTLFKESPNLFITVITILLLIVISYIIIKKVMADVPAENKTNTININ